MEKDGKSSGDFLVVCFLLGESSFGVDASVVQEIVPVGKLTIVHDAPADVIGIRNLRGQIVTVIDMAARLGLSRADLCSEGRLLILKDRGELYGFLVDTVTEAVELNERQITTPPANRALSPSLRSQLLGVWQAGDKLSVLLDSDKLFQGFNE